MIGVKQGHKEPLELKFDLSAQWTNDQLIQTKLYAVRLTGNQQMTSLPPLTCALAAYHASTLKARPGPVTSSEKILSF